MARKSSRVAELPADPYESAKVAGLRYVTPEGPGIERKRSGKGFSYIGVDGKTVTDEEVLERILSLVIPPAWTDVWICPSKNGHLQAVGRDARGRKQYRYHPIYRRVRDATKFGRMIAFAAALPTVRERVTHDLRTHGVTKQKVLATIVRLLETTAIRVGNEEYAKTNESYGLTTLKKDEHVDVVGKKLRFHFRGKSGVEHEVEVNDPKLTKIVKQFQCLPGEELFHYRNEEGEVCRIHSDDVNEYLQEITGEHFTAKDFRTWVGSGQAALALEQFGPCDTQTASKKNIVDAIKATATKLGNRPATCKKYYVHPAILEAYTQGTLFEALKAEVKAETGYELRREEVGVLSLLKAAQATLLETAMQAA